MGKKTYDKAAFPALCRSHALPQPIPEVKFHPDRQWRFDWLFPGRIAVEIQGGVWVRGKHGRGEGIVKDHDKLNAAQCMGYIVLQFTPSQIVDGSFAEVVSDALGLRDVPPDHWPEDSPVSVPWHCKKIPSIVGSPDDQGGVA